VLRPVEDVGTLLLDDGPGSLVLPGNRRQQQLETALCLLGNRVGCRNIGDDAFVL